MATLPGLISLYLLLAGLLTLIVAPVLVVLYRRRVRHHMAAGALPHGAGSGDFFEAFEPSPPAGRSASAAKYLPDALRAGDAAYGRAAIVYAIAGLTHAGLSVVIQLSMWEIDFLPLRSLVAFWAFAWPTLLTLVLFWGPDRARQGLTVLAYFAGLGLLCLWGGFFSKTPPLHLSSPIDMTLPAYAQPLFLWALDVPSSLFLTVFLNRRVRNVGPLILLFMTIAVSGAALVSAAYVSAPKWASGILGPIAAALGEWLPALSNGPDVVIVVYGTQLIGVLLFAFVAWRFVRWLVAAYSAKKISDQGLMFDSLWLLTTLFFCVPLVAGRGLIGFAGAATFVAYKAITHFGLAPLRRAAARCEAPQLLLLRVFGTRRRSEPLFDLLATRWRYAGNIELIAGPDLATSALDLHDFLDFVSGQLRANFIHSQQDLDRRIAAIDHGPDPDGRFRIDSLFCGPEAWRFAVARLMGDADAVLMDLRGFTAKNTGCIYELTALAKMNLLDRVILLIDHTTDEAFLNKLLAEFAQAGAMAGGRWRILRADRGIASAVQSVITMIGRPEPARIASGG